MTNTLQDLITRLEAAEGPDRELDCLIVAWREDREVYEEKGYILGRSRKPPHDTCRLGCIDPGKHRRNFTPAFRLPDWPAYTASVDAALSLMREVLPSAWLTIEVRQDYHHAQIDDLDVAAQNCPTPALAILQRLREANDR